MINRTLYRRISSHIVFKRPSEFLPHLFFSTIEEEGYDYNPSYNDDDVAPEKEPEIKVFKERRVDEFGRAYGTGRRKTSSARVWVFDGSGQITVNKRSFIDYFQPLQREHVLQAFHASKTAGQFDVYCTVKGGGITGINPNICTFHCPKNFCFRASWCC
jgi:hypothetical protein